jgi:hypothetical protein
MVPSADESVTESWNWAEGEPVNEGGPEVIATFGGTVSTIHLPKRWNQDQRDAGRTPLGG